jgi:hypothetical protein
MTRSNQGTDHAWLVMMKAMRALTRYAAAGIAETGLGLSDFGVLEVLLNRVGRTSSFRLSESIPGR